MGGSATWPPRSNYCETPVKSTLTMTVNIVTINLSDITDEWRGRLSVRPLLYGYRYCYVSLPVTSGYCVCQMSLTVPTPWHCWFSVQCQTGPPSSSVSSKARRWPDHFSVKKHSFLQNFSGPAKGYLITGLGLEVISLPLILNRPRNWPVQLSVNSVC